MSIADDNEIAGEVHICPDCGQVHAHAGLSVEGASAELVCDVCGARWSLSRRQDLLSDEDLHRVAWEARKPEGRTFGKRRTAIRTEILDAASKPGKMPSGICEEGIRDFSVGKRQCHAMEQRPEKAGFIPGHIGSLAAMLAALVILPQAVLPMLAGNGDEALPPNVDPITTASVNRQEAAEVSNVRFGNIRMVRIKRGQQNHVLVTGLMRNTGLQNLKSPGLNVRLVDPEGSTVQQWKHRLEREEFISGKILEFRTEVIQTGKNASRVIVSYEMQE